MAMTIIIPVDATPAAFTRRQPSFISPPACRDSFARHDADTRYAPLPFLYYLPPPISRARLLSSAQS